MRWGLIPNWSKEPGKFSMINARVETLLEKPAYKKPFLSQRCLIPADGFYEWKAESGKKIPYRFTLIDKGLFAFAGIYDIWKDTTGKEVKSFSIVTVTPNKIVEPIHNRMPAILKREHEKLWLHSTEPEKLIEKILEPYPSDRMKAFKISTLINSPRNESSDVIKPIEARTLFDY